MLPLLTIDTLASIFYATVLHPFPALLTTLSLVALGHSTKSSVFFSAACYLLITVIFDILQRLDTKIASGAPRKIDWESEVIVITGGAGGLGRLLAATYGMRGSSVAILDVKSLSGPEKEEFSERGINYYQCDVGDRKQVQAAMSSVEQDLGVPTILINNAAVVTGKQILGLSIDDLDRSYRVNLLSHYHTIQSTLPAMLRRSQGGTVVTVSSVLGNLGCAALSDYTAFKAAQIALHNSLTAELKMLIRYPTASGLLSTKGNDDRANSNNKIYPEAIKTVLVTPGQLSTPLFSSVTSPSTFFGPTVDVKDLAKGIIEAVDRGVNAEVGMPLYARWIAVLDVLPFGLRGVVRSMAGLDWAGWKGFVLESGK